MCRSLVAHNLQKTHKSVKELVTYKDYCFLLKSYLLDLNINNVKRTEAISLFSLIISYQFINREFTSIT